VRTTINVDDGVLARAKEFAARHRRTLNSVVEDALREMLARYEARAESPKVDLVVVTGDGLMPGVDLDSSAALHELLDEDAVIRYRRAGDAAD
jgi:hypothetical protein